MSGVLNVLICSALLSPFILFYDFFSRKLAADLQARVGPRRAGLSGLLQVLADYCKLVQKRPLRLGNAQSFLSLLIYGFFGATIAVLPLNSASPFHDSDLSLLTVIFLLMSVFFLLLFRGILFKKVPALLASLRFFSHWVAGLLPILVSTLAAGLAAGGLKWSQILHAQGFWPSEWLIFHVPLTFGLLASLTAHVVSVFFYW